ncbi:MAG: methionine synthase [Deltaproteobacteria bacterium]|nr:methionine synthase [Deltaproteobacteria bacterium]
MNLESLGIKLPLFPVSSVGSFPKPLSIKKARAQFCSGEISENELFEVEKEATRKWIEFQNDIGIDVVVDGEMYRGDMVAYFAERLPGFEVGGFVRSYGNRYYRKPIVTGKVSWEKPLTVSWWEYAQSLTKKPVKGMLTGPYTIMDWSFNEYYNSRRDTALALAQVVRREVEALIAAGARIIQIDEPACSVRTDELSLVVEAMDAVTRDLSAYFLTHICYGDFEKIYPGMLDIPVDNFDLEMSNSDNSLLTCFKKQPFTKDLSAGVVDVHTHRIESHEEVVKRIREIAEFVPLKQLWIDPDCGLKTRSVKEAKQKLRTIVDTVKELRKEFH